MTNRGDEAQPLPGEPSPRGLFRWECRCQQTPVLLGTYDSQGRVHIKVRDRYWHIDGTVRTVCPRCGSEHTLDVSRKSGVGSRKSSSDES
jgi:hypothetical protein